MLRPEMIGELRYFCAMVCYGVLVSFCYHLLLFFRALVRHRMPFTDAEDILFLMAAGVCFFLTAYEKNDGILRWYAFAGAAFGILAYIRTVGAALENVRKWLLQKLSKTVRIKAKFSSKGQVPLDEAGNPEHEDKRKEKKRT